MANVRFVRTTKERQINRKNYDENALYFCIDSGELYRGEQLLSDGVRQVTTYADLPNYQVAADGVIYYTINEGNGYMLNESRDNWTQVIFATVGDISTVSSEDDDKYIPTVGAVKKALERYTPSGDGGVYELPVADDATLGGVRAIKKTDEMTQAVGIDEEGYLWVNVPDVTYFVTREYVDAKTETVEKQVIELETTVETITNQMNDVSQKFDDVQNTIETQMTNIETKIEKMETKIEEVAGGLDPNETYVFDGGEI